jgi:hypothetical protein
LGYSLNRTATLSHMRYTFATLAISVGENINWVARRLGHKSPVVTLERYSRFGPNLTRTDGKALLGVQASPPGNVSRQKSKLGNYKQLCGKLVVPTGLFPVITGIYMPNNFKGLNRDPCGYKPL